MLKKEDCKPGVEVIVIKDIPGPNGRRPMLGPGNIYTINQYHENYQDHKGKPNIENISLKEVKLHNSGIFWGYQLDQFKLRDKEEFTELFKTSDENLKKFREVREYV